MLDDVPDVPRWGVIYGGVCAAYHLFDDLALDVPPSPRLKEIRRLIAVLKNTSDQSKEAGTRAVDGKPSTQDGSQDPDKPADPLQDLDKLTADLLAARPTNWCDLVARAELATLYAPNEYDNELPSKYGRLVAELVRTVLKLGQKPEPAPRGPPEPEQAVEYVGCVYLAQSGQHFKIGRSNGLEQRILTLQIQLPDKLVLVHHIKTDDPAGIEAYWHRRFAGKRKNGEWFELSAEDVEMFKARTVM